MSEPNELDVIAAPRSCTCAMRRDGSQVCPEHDGCTCPYSWIIVYPFDHERGCPAVRARLLRESARVILPGKGDTEGGEQR